MPFWPTSPFGKITRSRARVNGAITSWSKSEKAEKPRVLAGVSIWPEGGISSRNINKELWRFVVSLTIVKKTEKMIKTLHATYSDTHI